MCDISGWRGTGCSRILSHRPLTGLSGNSEFAGGRGPQDASICESSYKSYHERETMIF